METFTRLQVLMVAASWALAALVSAPGARADIPACNAVYNDSTIATCTCICEASSSYPGCNGLSEGKQAATPSQCPDMLQGRHVLSGGDVLAIASPRLSGSANTVALGLLYGTENDSPNTGLGVINGTPSLTLDQDIGCRTTNPFPDHVVLARLFDLPYDMMVQLRPTTPAAPDCGGAGNNMELLITSPKSDAPSVPTYQWQTNNAWTQLAVGDVNYDGYDDLIFMNVDVIQVYTAVDPTDPTKGIERVASLDTRVSSSVLRSPINTPVTGDFNGDGIMDVAWIGGNFPNSTGTLSVFFASICPGSVTSTICDGKQPFQVILDPASQLFPNVSGATSTIALDDATLTPTQCGVTQTARAENKATGALRAGAIALGNFENSGYNSRGAPIDGLVVAYVAGTSPNHSDADACKLNIQYWSYASLDTSTSSTVWAQQRGDTLVTPLTYDKVQLLVSPTYSLYAQAAYLDWYGTVQQAVIGVSGLYPGFQTFWYPTTVSVSGTGDAAFATECDGETTTDGTYGRYAWGLAVGRFSTSTTVNPDNSGACGDFASANPGDCPYNPQIGMLVAQDNQNGGGSGNPLIQLYSAVASDPGGSDNSRKCANDANIPGYVPLAGRTNDLTSGYHSVPPVELRAGSLVSPGDAYGNSVRLGQPTITRVDDHSGPQLIIQAPPSHIDYVQPEDSDSAAPAIVNFTRAPRNYQTKIQFASGSDDTASTRETRSISSSTTETVSGEVKYKVPLIAQVDAKDTQSWTQFNQSSHQQQLSTYSTTRLQTNAAIGADDQIWWTETTFNVFNYPELGVTQCPASTTCDPSDPVCTGTFSNAELTCSKQTDSSVSGYPNCTCLSAGAAGATQCPDLSTTGTSRSCALQSDNSVCCTLLPQQLNVSFSGPKEVKQNSGAGATIEWYQPLHEPGQILSYPSSIALVKARQQDTQTLASLTSFTLGPNTTSESIHWSCSTNSDVSTGTTTRHSFKSDSAITFGTNKIAEDAAGAASVSFKFDYQHSDAFSTLNTYTVGQTASSSVALLMESAGFFKPDEYGYSVSGAVLGATRPESVLDNPDLTVCPVENPNCSAAQEVQADCQTTGPLSVAYAAEPPAMSSTSWWGSGNPYRANIDVALNNPLRWHTIPEDQALNSTLQCRGEQEAGTSVCYDTNTSPGVGAAFGAVWSSEFYNMKGFFVTDGGATGPMRNTATVGDTIYLRARVYNYSLLATNSNANPNSKVYARFYRQQIDVNDSDGYQYARDANGDDLPAVPIGPKGLNDTDPVPVVGPDGVSNAIPGFNTTSNSAADNIGLATVSYTTGTDDDCEYDSGVQTCNGAYYVYWVTVWAEDASGNVISELPGHNLGTGFELGTSYDYITDVPLEQSTLTSSDGSTSKTESFTNNVGMFKMLFSIVPPDTSGTLTAGAIRPRPGLLSLDRMAVSSDKTVLGQPVVVSAQVVESGESAPGATVVFSDGDPNNGGKAFDAEWLPTIRAHDRHFVSVNYHPESCGPHAIYANVTGGSNVRPAEQFAMVDVGIDYHSAIDYLIRQVDGLAGKMPGHQEARVSSRHARGHDDPWRKVSLPAEHGRGHEEPWRKGHGYGDHHSGDGGLPPGQIRVLEAELTRAERALDADRTDRALHSLENFTDRITRLGRKGRIDKDQVDHMIAQVQRIIGCVQ